MWLIRLYHLEDNYLQLQEEDRLLGEEVELLQSATTGRLKMREYQRPSTSLHLFSVTQRYRDVLIQSAP